jgi:aldose 1-epimerase
MRFSARTERDSQITFIVLSHDGGGNEARAMEAWIAPGFGANMCRFTVGGKAVIDFDRALLLARDFTGTPVLYPTPNRVRGAAFRWKGELYRQVRGGKPVLEHGLAHAESWQAGEPGADHESARIEMRLEFSPGQPLYQCFPFPHSLGLEFRLGADGVRVSYRIRNGGQRAIPFGFGLHPYFMKLSGEEATFVSLPAEAVMDATPDLLPTGRLLDVGGTIYDLRSPAAVGALDLDHVFTRIHPGGCARIEYRGAGMGLELRASPDFSHLVLYTPRGERYFCLENQTCSTDAHNLFDRGFEGESGLKSVAPGSEHEGSVSYTVLFAPDK